MAFVIADPCIGSKEGSCVEVCPVDCIHTTPEADQYFINPAECINCGACMDVCPTRAIYGEDEIPAAWASATERNAAFFAERGR